MSDTAPDRKIGGLTKRGTSPDLSFMQRKNRITEPPEAIPAGEATPTNVEAAPSTRRSAKKTAEKGRTSRKTSDNAETAKTQVTAYMSPAVRNRARAAFKATAHLEGDRNWSAFIEEAVLAETQRREQQHNDGQEYSGGEEPLSPGRTIA